MPPSTSAPTIKILPPELTTLIAAGEVVERPASVVKELLENALDAGASAINIELQDGGLALIRVSDDGCGMNRADAELAGQPFATSKINAPADLEAIRTFGFRGEALSSIAAVARLDILTRTGTELEGTRAAVRGAAIDIAPAASPVGTSVT
ncbi:MAG: DNA mismatch repair endonuclease MutL, partial [Anaerolineae bacterium]